MSTATWVTDEERAALRQLRREGRTIEEIVVLTGRCSTTVHENVQGVETTMTAECGWCEHEFQYEPRRGRPPGFCGDECRYQMSLKRKRDARAA